MALVTVARKGEIANGKMIGVEAGGRKLLIASYGGKLYAMDAVCSHMGGDLSKGRFESDVVICPRHGAQYDIRTGRLIKDVGFAAKALTMGRGAHEQAMFEVVVEGDEVKVALD
jgi:3-phenylpropionate/trans-cinnamate dioxygenase ferredoxin component